MIAHKTHHKICQVEREFSEPFWQIVQGCADMGYSKQLTADAIDWDRSSFYRMLKKHGQHIRWCDYADYSSWHGREYPRDMSKRIKAGMRNSRKTVLVEYGGELMTQAECARVMGRSEKYVRALRQRGEIKKAPL